MQQKLLLFIAILSLICIVVLPGVTVGKNFDRAGESNLRPRVVIEHLTSVSRGNEVLTTDSEAITHGSLQVVDASGKTRQLCPLKHTDGELIRLRSSVLKSEEGRRAGSVARLFC